MARARRFGLALLALLALGLPAALAVAPQGGSADAGAQAGAPLDAKSIDAVSGAFVRLLSDPYTLSSSMLPSEYSLARANLSREAVAAVNKARAQLRQAVTSLADRAAGAASDFVASAERAAAEASASTTNTTLRAGLLAGSIVPLAFDGKGRPLLSNPLAALGTYLAKTLQSQLKLLRDSAPGQLQAVLGGSAAGRRLLQEFDELEARLLEDVSAAGGDEEAAAASQVHRLVSFLSQLADAADDVELLVAGLPEDDGEDAYDDDCDQPGSGSASSDASADAEARFGGLAAAATRRRLAQAADGRLEEINGGYAKAFRLIFTNIFDFFRAGGLYGLTPLLADLRGFLTRYNWIADLLNIIDAPLENFVNANYFPLPQSNDDFTKLVRKFAADYCKFEEAASSETVLGAFEGPSLSYELKPVSCPVFADATTGRAYVSFADCDPAQLVIKVTPLTITEAYFTAASYTSTECKYTEPFGVDVAFALGGGERLFNFTRSAKGIDIIPTVVQLNGRQRFQNFLTPYGPDGLLVGGPLNAQGQPLFGDGFFANNFGWSFAGLNPPKPGAAAAAGGAAKPGGAAGGTAKPAEAAKPGSASG